MIRRFLVSALLACTMTALPARSQEGGLNAGRNLAAACASCHGTNGANQSAIPTLAGRRKDFLVQRMREFKSGERPATVMQQIARGYTDGQVEALAAYLAAQKAN